MVRVSKYIGKSSHWELLFCGTEYAKHQVTCNLETVMLMSLSLFYSCKNRVQRNFRAWTRSDYDGKKLKPKTFPRKPCVFFTWLEHTAPLAHSCSISPLVCFLVNIVRKSQKTFRSLPRKTLLFPGNSCPRSCLSSICFSVQMVFKPALGMPYAPVKIHLIEIYKQLLHVRELL